MSTGNVATGVFVLVIVLAAFVASTCFFILDEREQAVVTRLNRPVRIVVGDIAEDAFEQLRQEIVATARRTESGIGDGIRVDQGAGLYFKMPFVDSIERFPDTVLEYDVDPEDTVLADKKTLRVDNYARWRIVNPLLYRVRVRTEVAARGVLDDVIYSVLREELGKSDLTEVIRTTNNYVNEDLRTEEEEALGVRESPSRELVERGREEIMNAVTKRANDVARPQYGIEILDVRIKRAELVEVNLESVFERMKAERSRISKGYLSEGQKEAEIIRGDTDRQVRVLLANANREAEILRGEGDAQALRTYAEAFGANADFYEFLQSLEVMKNATQPGTELIVGLDSSIYKLLRGD